MVLLLSAEKINHVNKLLPCQEYPPPLVIIGNSPSIAAIHPVCHSVAELIASEISHKHYYTPYTNNIQFVTYDKLRADFSPTVIVK
jgi:hypothetical protein